MFSRLGVATDLSPASEPAVEMAAQLAKQFKCPLVLIHVYDLPITPIADAALVLPAEYMTNAMHAADERLAAIQQRLSEGGALEVEVSTSTGGFVDEIIEAVTKQDVGLLVLGSRGRTGLSRVLLGSVAERVLRASPIPTLLVPARDKED